jgi:hypothetical protein
MTRSARVRVVHVGIGVISLVLIASACSGSSASHVQASALGRPTAASCTGRLLAAVAVLRRPQTRADRAFNPQRVRITGISQSKPFPYVVVPGLTRLARTLPNGQPVFFVVYRPLPHPLVPSLGDVLQVFVPSPGGRSAAFVTEVLPPALSYAYRQPPIRIGDFYLGLVPNGVARVRWTFPREAVPRIRAPGGPVFRAHVISGAEITASVRGNIAAAKEPPHPVSLPSGATWLAADGNELKAVKYYVPTFPVHGIPKSTGTVTLRLSGTPVPASC